MKFPLFLYYQLDSTMEQAKRLIDQGHESGLVVAYTQTNGHGRFQREWVSPEGNFYGTFFLKKSPISGILSLNTALHVFHKIAPFCKGELKLKWPNDLLLDDKKVSGILLEKFDDFLLAGIGINLKNYPSNINQPATCLFPDDSIQIELPLFCDMLKEGFEASLDAPFDLNTYQQNMHGLNQSCTVTISKDQTVEGICKGIDQAGALLLEVDREIQKIYSGDTIF